MAKTKKRTDGRYQKCFVYEGKRYSVYGTSVRDAELKKAEKIKQIEEGIANHSNPKLNDYYEHFTELRRSNTRSATLRGQINQFNKCANIVIYNAVPFGDMRMRDIKPKDLQTIQMALIEKGNSTRTVNDAMAHLNHVFNEAVKDETIDRNPCIAVTALKRTEPPARETIHRALTVEETNLFLQTAADNSSFFLNLFRLLFCTGMRIGEAAALTLSDIDNRYIHINKTVTRNEFGCYVIGDAPKTKDSIRDIPLNPTIRKIITDQKEMNAIINNNVINLNKPIFTSPRGEILREYTFNREIKRITKKCDIEYFSSHAFRATFATRFIEQRPEDYKTLSELLGHSDTQITLNLYTHVMEDTKIKAMNAINIAF